MATNRTWRRLLWIAAAVVLFAASLEMLLRLQQWLGPVYDLATPHGSLEWHSDVVNHRPPAHTIDRLEGGQYGQYDGYAYALDYDETGIRVPHSVATGDRCARTLELLYIGDSFMEGYDVPRTVPDLVARLLAARGICSQTLNAGHSSYAPAIYVPLARQLLARLSPDYVIVDIDETDLGDDVYRYEKLIVRNAAGENVGVRADPLQHRLNLWQMAVSRQPLYLQRLFSRLYIRYAIMPQIVPVTADHFRVSKDRDPGMAERNAPELAIFRRNLEELMGVLLKHLPPDRIVFIRHPYLPQLVNGADGRPMWNDIAARTVEQVVTARGAVYFDATSEFRRRAAPDPAAYYWPGDIHFNFEGQRLYADIVAAFLEKTLGERRAR